MRKIYTGIGSRETPVDILRLMGKVAYALAKKDWVLRSGAAPGADQAFEAGCDHGNGSKEIYLPWKGFEKNPSRYIVQDWTEEIASKYHPAWTGLSQGIKKLHSRNVHQILGFEGNDPSHFVVCWTPDGCESHLSRKSSTGGTGQAISIATDYAKIPVFNLFNEDALDRIKAYLKEIEK